LIYWIRSLFAWCPVRDSGVWLYLENSVTGQRAARRISKTHQPLDFDWLDAGRGHPTIDGIPAWRTAQGQGNDRYFL